MYNNRPIPLPPTNVEIGNDYRELDSGLFMDRNDPPTFLRVSEAIWITNGPSTAPGILKFKLRQYATQPVTEDDFEGGTPYIPKHSNNEWFEVQTTGPAHAPILVEYWAKHIFYNYYMLFGNNVEDVSSRPQEIDRIAQTGKSFTRALNPKVDSVVNTVRYAVSKGKPLQLISYQSNYILTETGLGESADMMEDTANLKFDPVISLYRHLTLE